jgi:LPXTG-motif cell wall-anchored protein
MTAPLRRRRAGALALAVFGIVSLLAAFVPGVANAAAVAPDVETFPGGDPICAAGTGFRINDPDTGSHPDPDSDFAVDITVHETALGPTFDFVVTSGHLVLTVFVKGGTTQNVYSYPAPGVSSDTGLHSPINPANNEYFGLSHVDFCFGEGEEPETYTVIPEKVWDDEYGEGFSAVITITPDDGVTPAKSWIFDDEGNRDHDDPIEIPVGVGYDWDEEYTVPAGWECEASEVTNGVVALAAHEVDETVTILNTCEEDETPPPPPPPPPPPATTPTTQPAPATTTTTEPEVAGEVVEVEQEQVEAAPATLPRTGVGSLPLAATGIAALLSGLGLLRIGRREDV